MLPFLASIICCNSYLLIDLNFVCCIASYVFFHSAISGCWLWNLQGIYSLVLEINEDVPYKIGDQGLPECHVLFVSGV